MIALYKDMSTIMGLAKRNLKVFQEVRNSFCIHMKTECGIYGSSIGVVIMLNKEILFPIRCPTVAIIVRTIWFMATVASLPRDPP